MNIENVLNNLIENHSLTLEEYEFLLKNLDSNVGKILQKVAVALRQKFYKNHVYLRALIEISNICKNDCFYCGIRKSNTNIERYRLTKDEILQSCNTAYDVGIKTFVLQGAEDEFFNDEILSDIIRSIKNEFRDCALTLSLGERSVESFQTLFNAGADRYLLRHETANKIHYEKLHPSKMDFDNRIKCLYELKKIGYQTGCGFMVGSPYQKLEYIAQDLKFIEDFQPEMCGIGPFIPHVDTEFANFEAGSVELTCSLLSIIRIICPTVLMPATTALSTLDENGYVKGLKSGANVIMPNFTPEKYASNYKIYNGKTHAYLDKFKDFEKLKSTIESSGFQIISDIGNPA